jgi:23S rRNA pseudouridine1911/1915/1917 synthase
VSIEFVGAHGAASFEDPEYLTVPERHAGLELDEYLALLYPQINKGSIRQQIRSGRVLIDGERVQPSVRISANQVLVVELDPDLLDKPLLEAPEIEVPVLYEDGRVLVVDKPAGVAVEPERWLRSAGSMAGAMLRLALARGDEAPDADPDLEPEPGVEGEAADADGRPRLRFRPRIVHRLDKDTSGVLLIAKDLAAERLLRGAFEHAQVKKTYLALVEGECELADGEIEWIDLPIGADPRKSGRMRIDPAGKPSRTAIGVSQRFRGYTLLHCHPETGRTHQIRLHCAARGFPLVVDKLYGRQEQLLLSDIKRGYRAKPGRSERPLLDRLSLHAFELDFPLPAALDGADDSAQTQERRTVQAPLPKDLQMTLKQLGKVRPPRR